MKTKRRASSARAGGARNGAVTNGTIKAKRMTVNGKPMILLDEAEYDRLLIKADEIEPAVPEPDANGNYPIEVIRIDLAIRIIRHRRKAGLTQAELARRAGIRLETLNRVEQGRDSASTRTIEKIDRVLCDLVEE